MTLTESSRKGSALAQFQQIYRWQLKRSRLISILCLGLTFLCFSVVHLCKSVRSYHDYFDNPSELGENVSHAYLLKQFAGTIQANLMTGMATILIPLLLVFLVVSAIQTFQYMHNKRRSVDLFHALPIRRTPLLLGNMAAIGTVLGGVAVLNLLLCGVVDMAMGAEYSICWLLGQLGYLLLLLAASLCGTVFLLVACGTVSGAVIAGILLTVGWPLLVTCGAAIIRGSLPGSQLVASGAVLTALTPYLALFVPDSVGGGMFLSAALFGDPTYDSSGSLGGNGVTVWFILWWVLVTAVLLTGCILVYRKRKSEAAENNFSYPGLRIVIRFIISGAVGLGCALFFGNLSGSNVVFYLTAVLASELTHVITQVVWVREVRELPRSLLYYAALAVAMAVFFVGLATGGLGYVNRIPAEGDVDYIRVDLPGYHFDDSKETYLYSRTRSLTVDTVLPEDEDVLYKDNVDSFSVEPRLQKSKSIQTVQALHQTILSQYQAPYLPVREEGDYHCLLTYTLKNGEELERNYILPGRDQDLGDLNDYTTEPHSTPELLRAMADVVHLDEIQAFTMLDFYTPQRVENVRVELEDEKGGASLHGEPGKELTAKQKKQVWNTFLRELNSDRFRWTYPETISTIGQTNYYIDVDADWAGTDWPEKLKTLIQNCSDAGVFDPGKQSKLSVTDIYYFSVPKSCTKTRALIDKWIGGNIQEGDVDTIVEDTY